MKNPNLFVVRYEWGGSHFTLHQSVEGAIKDANKIIKNYFDGNDDPDVEKDCKDDIAEALSKSARVKDGQEKLLSRTDLGESDGEEEWIEIWSTPVED
jgi:hypothetical protein